MAERLSKSLLYTYGIADMFFLLMINMEMFYFAAFLTDYAQFSLATIGVILWITGVVDIVCALAAGVILQRVTLKYGGKYRSWFLVGPPIVAPLYVLQFSRLGGDLTAASIIVASFILSHLLYNVVFTATGSMVGRLSQLPEERTILSTSRSQGWSAAGLIFSITGPPMIMFFGRHMGKVSGFAITVIVYAALMVLGYWYLYRITAGRDPYEDAFLHASKDESKQSLKEIIGLVLGNPPLLLLISAETFRYAGISVTTAFAFYFFNYVLKNLAFMAVFLLATSISMLIGAFFSTWIGIQIGKRRCYWIFLILSAVTFASAKFFGKTAWSFTTIVCVSSFLGSIAGSVITALFADTVIYGEWKTRKNISGFAMALLNFPIKLGILIRSAVVTLGLMAIGFVANAVPAPGVVDGISFIMIFIPAAASAIAAIIFYYGYRIEDRNVIRMQDEIAARKASRLAAAEVRS
jgi:Na+/melibiose symporter-like transporter